MRRRPGQNDLLIIQALRQAGRPLSAYHLARVVSGEGDAIMPGQVYRTLERLIEQGLVLRIALLNAYYPRPAAGDLCLICTGCHGVTFVEAPGLQACVARVGEAHRFAPSTRLVEAFGQCPTCSTTRPVSPGR
jgi:Fur family zinc uptake transcriptional regulator